MADALPVWVVEATKYKDLNKEALSAALVDAIKQPASLLLVFVLTEVTCSRGTELPSSEVDTKTAMEHGRRMIEALLRPMLSLAKAKDVVVNAVVERNDIREQGLCAAARRANAERVYICLKKKLLGFTSSASAMASPWLGLLPPTTVLVISQLGKRPEVTNGTGSPQPTFRIPSSAFISCRYSSSKSTSSVPEKSNEGRSLISSKSFGSSPAHPDGSTAFGSSTEIVLSPSHSIGSARSSGQSPAVSLTNMAALTAGLPQNGMGGAGGRAERAKGKGVKSLLVPGAVYSAADEGDMQAVGSPVSSVSVSSDDDLHSPGMQNQLSRFGQESEFAGLAASLLSDTVGSNLHPPSQQLPPRPGNHAHSLPTVPEAMLDEMLDRTSSTKSVPVIKSSSGGGSGGTRNGSAEISGETKRNPLAAELALLEEDEEEGEEKDIMKGKAVTSNRPTNDSSESYIETRSQRYSQKMQMNSGPMGLPLTGPAALGLSGAMSITPNQTGPFTATTDMSMEQPTSQSTRFKDFSSTRYTASRFSNNMGGQSAGMSQGRYSVGMDGTVMTIGDGYDCRLFTSKQLEKATMGYARTNLLGRGSFGQVFKGEMLGCKVAVKKLEGAGWQGPDEFRMEVEVLSRMRHPNIVLLMGCSLDEHALVYEYLPAGTLQDKLGPSKGKGEGPLTWFDRLRIFAEVSSALLYLHQNDPPIVHRDLKPDNILLDAHLISKIGDVGLARLLNAEDAMTMKVRGTAGYIDPEEVETCEISVKSDIYALGLIFLQLLTGQRSVKAVHRMLTECAGARMAAAAAAAKNGDMEQEPSDPAVQIVMKYVDTTGGDWRMDLAERAAAIALQCAERKRKARPELADTIHPELVKIAEEAAEEEKRRKRTIDSQFVCPLSKEVMRDPVVAADGFTYEKEHITKWMENCSLSPSTGLALAHMCLTPNNALKTLLQSHTFH